MNKMNLCKIHGKTFFYKIKNKNNFYYKCKKCNVDAVQKSKKKNKIDGY